jgi:hypothetical protein
MPPATRPQPVRYEWSTLLDGSYPVNPTGADGKSAAQASEVRILRPPHLAQQPSHLHKQAAGLFAVCLTVFSRIR